MEDDRKKRQHNRRSKEKNSTPKGGKYISSNASIRSELSETSLLVQDLDEPFKLPPPPTQVSVSAIPVSNFELSLLNSQHQFVNLTHNVSAPVLLQENLSKTCEIPAARGSLQPTFETGTRSKNPSRAVEIPNQDLLSSLDNEVSRYQSIPLQPRTANYDISTCEEHPTIFPSLGKSVLPKKLKNEVRALDPDLSRTKVPVTPLFLASGPQHRIGQPVDIGLQPEIRTVVQAQPFFGQSRSEVQDSVSLTQDSDVQPPSFKQAVLQEVQRAMIEERKNRCKAWIDDVSRLKTEYVILHDGVTTPTTASSKSAQFSNSTVSLNLPVETVKQLQYAERIRMLSHFRNSSDFSYTSGSQNSNLENCGHPSGADKADGNRSRFDNSVPCNVKVVEAEVRQTTMNSDSDNFSSDFETVWSSNLNELTNSGKVKGSGETLNQYAPSVQYAAKPLTSDQSSRQIVLMEEILRRVNRIELQQRNLNLPVEESRSAMIDPELSYCTEPNLITGAENVRNYPTNSNEISLPLLMSTLGNLNSNQTNVEEPELPELKFKPIDLPTYSGVSDRISASNFIRQLQHLKQTKGYSDRVFVTKCLPLTLTNEAADWFFLNQPFENFSEFSAQFLNHFHPETKNELLLENLRRTKQGATETFDAFYTRCSVILKQLDDSCSLQTKIYILKQGLSNRLRPLVVHQNFSTLVEFYNHCYAMESFCGSVTGSNSSVVSVNEHVETAIVVGAPDSPQVLGESSTIPSTQMGAQGATREKFCLLHNSTVHDSTECFHIKALNNALKSKTTTMTKIMSQIGAANTPTTSAGDQTQPKTSNTVTASKQKQQISCSTCAKVGHTSEKCWTTHPELRRIWLDSRNRTQVASQIAQATEGLNPNAPEFPNE